VDNLISRNLSPSGPLPRLSCILVSHPSIVGSGADGRLRKVDPVSPRLAIEVEPVEQCRPMGVQEPS
jgi:hypothetical protein